jgi:menaquinone-dependent protoporphyrinogen oxidase
MSILILYSTTDGQTLKISQHLQKNLLSQGKPVTLSAIQQAPLEKLQDFDQILIGASIRYGHHAKEVLEFIHHHQSILNQKWSGFFSVNLVARKPEKQSAETNPYVRKFLRKISWKPKVIGVFAGKLDYPHYSYWDRQVIRLIMWITHGPTDPSTVIEYTDWEQVDLFSKNLLDF